MTEIFAFLFPVTFPGISIGDENVSGNMRNQKYIRVITVKGFPQKAEFPDHKFFDKINFNPGSSKWLNTPVWQ